VGAAPLRLSVPACRRRDRADGRPTRRKAASSLSRRAVPAREPAHPQADEAPANAEGTLRRIEAWRAARPDLVIRSTFIAGFPGETEREFEELLAFLEAAQLDRVGCFAYSPVEGAAANALPDPVPDAVKEERRARFMAVQASISARRLARRVGETIAVLVDGHDGTDAIARSAADAPEIDGTVRIANGTALPIGSFARVRVTGAGEHDLDARLDAAKHR
jgi:ribosomal protein S12 methylthiotransferase